MLRTATALVLLIFLAAPALGQGKSNDKAKGKGKSHGASAAAASEAESLTDSVKKETQDAIADELLGEAPPPHSHATGGSMPPGLEKKGELPPGLAKKDKTPPGWSEGEKEGWSGGPADDATTQAREDGLIRRTIRRIFRGDAPATD